MEASPNQLIQFFNGFKQSVIPLFQRPYEWKEKNWDILWQDIIERYEANKDVSHFMGTIVTMPSRSVPVGVSKHLIIDGQQRLTTFAIFLCAIRDELPVEATVEKQRIQKHYLVNDGYEEHDHFKLLPTQDDRETFFNLVKNKNGEKPNQMRAAYDYYVVKMRDGDSDGNPIDLRRLLDTIERKLIIVNINLSEYDDPYLIFESLNAKGSPLTQADLVRNYFLMKFPVNDQEEIYKEFWLPMQRRLGDNLTEFMRHYLMRVGEEVLKGDVYGELKRRIQDFDAGKIRLFLEDMNKVSVFYLKLIVPSEESDSDISDRLDQIFKWEVTTAFPLLLKIYDEYSSNTISREDIISCLTLVESFVVRRAVCSVPTNQLKRVFLQIAKNFKNVEIVSWLKSELEAGTSGKRWPGDAEFRDSWIRFKAYGVPRRCRLLLASIEKSYGHKEPAELEAATIEHVMPQNLNEGWRLALGDLADEVHAQFGDTIGNLTLTAYNSELSNMVFDEKKNIYSSSHYSLNAIFSDVDNWTAKEIVLRAEILLERARKIWPGPSK